MLFIICIIIIYNMSKMTYIWRFHDQTSVGKYFWRLIENQFFFFFHTLWFLCTYEDVYCVLYTMKKMNSGFGSLFYYNYQYSWYMCTCGSRYECLEIKSIDNVVSENSISNITVCSPSIIFCTYNNKNVFVDCSCWK